MSLSQWFRENWVDLSRPKKGGGYEPCGRKDADEGKYPKCVPASRAAKMTPEEIKSAVRRKRKAESTKRREGKKPINVDTVVEKKNVPTNPKLYAEVKAAAKRKFDVYPSAYANGWLVQEYKRRGGGYKTVTKSHSGVSKHAEHDQKTHGRRKSGRVPPIVPNEKDTAGKYSAEARRLAELVRDRAASREPKITKDVLAAIDTAGGKAYGLEYRLKTEESLARKIDEVYGKTRQSREDIAGAMHDVVRYTTVIEAGDYTKGMNRTLAELGAMGYEIDLVKNFWRRGDAYDGINVRMSNPDGQMLELQFHTPASLATKDRAHAWYKKYRVEESPIRRYAYWQNMTELWATVEIPDGALKVGVQVFEEYSSVIKAEWLSLADDFGVQYRFKDTGKMVVEEKKVGGKWVPAVGEIVCYMILGTWDGDDYQPSKVAKHAEHDQSTHGRRKTSSGVSARARKVLSGSGERIELSALGIQDAPPALAKVANRYRDDDKVWGGNPTKVSWRDKFIGTEGSVKKKHVAKVVEGREPLREGYPPRLFEMPDGRYLIADGHHRLAMHSLMESEEFDAVVVPFPTGEVAKHAEHDQKTHGRRKTTRMQLVERKGKKKGTFRLVPVTPKINVPEKPKGINIRGPIERFFSREEDIQSITRAGYVDSVAHSRELLADPELSEVYWEAFLEVPHLANPDKVANPLPIEMPEYYSREWSGSSSEFLYRHGGALLAIKQHLMRQRPPQVERAFEMSMRGRESYGWYRKWKRGFSTTNPVDEGTLIRIDEEREAEAREQARLAEQIRLTPSLEEVYVRESDGTWRDPTIHGWMKKHAEHDQKTHGRRKTSLRVGSFEDYSKAMFGAEARKARGERPSELRGWKGPKTFEQRLSRCYELSFECVVRTNSKTKLVHGSIHGPGADERIPHSWVELSDGTIYDPVLDLWFPPEDWALGFGAEPAVKYSREDGVEKGIDEGNMGPWHDAPYGNKWYEERGV